MLKTALRFHGRRSVMRALNSGQVIKGRGFQLRYKKSFRTSYRVGVTVSKKVAKSAVVRNRIRRRIYELFRKEELLKGRKVDVLVIVHDANLAKLPSKKIKQDLKDATASLLGML